jgi:hypothetical protein
MAGGNSSNVTIEIDSTAGGSLADYTAQIDKIGDCTIKNGVITNTPFGTTAVAKAFTGMVEADSVTIEGEISDSASHVYQILMAARGGVSRTMKLTFLTGEYVSCEVLVESIKRSASVGAISRWAAVLTPTGTITES